MQPSPRIYTHGLLLKTLCARSKAASTRTWLGYTTFTRAAVVGEDREELTGLNPQQLQPIIRRLEGLGLIEGSNLTSRANPLLKAKRLLHGQTKCLWLDGKYRWYSFCAVPFFWPSNLELDSAAKFGVRVTMTPCAAWQRSACRSCPRLWVRWRPRDTRLKR
ncbi:hypothetical protein EMIT0196MI5_130052 [Pseudomonas sp. IT-196MI5]